MLSTEIGIYMFLQVGGKKEFFKIRDNLGDYNNQYLIERYRLDRYLIENVCDLVWVGWGGGWSSFRLL